MGEWRYVAWIHSQERKINAQTASPATPVVPGKVEIDIA